MFLAVNCEQEFGDFVIYIKKIITLIKIAAPLVLIILGSLDFARAVIGKDDAEIAKGKKRFLNRLILAVAIFMIFSIFELINNILVSIGINSEWISCWGLK